VLAHVYQVLRMVQVLVIVFCFQLSP
jgi:hypothetical protein